MQRAAPLPLRKPPPPPLLQGRRPLLLLLLLLPLLLAVRAGKVAAGCPLRECSC